MELYYTTHNIYFMYDAGTLTWPHFCVRYRESAQPVVTDGITVTPTSPAQWTRKTSTVSSLTVGTSFSGCTCGSTSSCDGQQPHVLHSPHPPQPPPTWPSPTIVQTARKGPPYLTTWPTSHFQCVQLKMFFFFWKTKSGPFHQVPSRTDWGARPHFRPFKIGAPSFFIRLRLKTHYNIEHGELWKTHKLTRSPKNQHRQTFNIRQNFSSAGWWRKTKGRQMYRCRTECALVCECAWMCARLPHKTPQITWLFLHLTGWGALKKYSKKETR